MDELRRKGGMVLVSSVIWALAGGLFGLVFVATLRYLEHQDAGPWQVMLAAALAGAFVAAFYSAKRVAVLGAAAGSFASLVYLVQAPTLPDDWRVLVLCGAVGVLAGAFASVLYERRQGVLLVAVAGLLAGAFTGLAAGEVARVAGGVAPPWLLAALLVPATGGLFTGLSVALGPRVETPVPQWIGVGLVAGGMAAVAGLGLWVLAAPLAYPVDPALLAALSAMLAEVPGSFAGGAAGGAVGGALVELVDGRWLPHLRGAGGGMADAPGPAGHVPSTP
jgi:hypothetical protein